MSVSMDLVRESGLGTCLGITPVCVSPATYVCNCETGIRFVVASGGDIVLGDAPPNKKGWIVGVNKPEQAEDLLPEKLQLHNLSVATSGDVYQFIEHNGKKYSHIIDPATGYGVSSLRNVTVIAKDGALADWLATACSILPINQAKKLATTMHAELLITEFRNNRIQPYTTQGFEQYWEAPLIQEKQ